MPSTRLEANTHYNTGALLAREGKFQEALPCYQQALRIYNELLIESVNLANIHFSIGICLQKLNKNVDALTAFQTCLALREKLLAPNHENILKAQKKIDEMSTREMRTAMVIEDSANHCYRYVPQGYAMTYEPAKEPDVAGLTTNEFSNCHIIAFMNHADEKYVLLHADPAVTPDHVAEIMQWVGEPCEKKVFRRSPEQEFYTPGIHDQLLQQVLGKFYSQFTLCNVDKETDHLVITKNDVFLIPDRQFKGKLLRHPDDLRISLVRTLDPFLNPDSTTIRQHMIFLFVDGQWQENLAEHDLNLTQEAQETYQTLELNKQMPFIWFYNKITELADSKPIYGLLQLVKSKSREDNLLTGAHRLQRYCCLLAGGDYEEILRVNIAQIFYEEHSPVSNCAKFINQVEIAFSDTKDFPLRAKQITDTAKNSRAYQQDPDFNELIICVNQFLGFYFEWTQRVQEQVERAANAPGLGNKHFQ